MHLSLEGVDEVLVGFALDLSEHSVRLFLCLADNHKAIDGELDLTLSSILFRTLLDILDLRFEPGESIAVHEVVIADSGGIVLCIVTVASLEDFGVWTTLDFIGLGFERVVVELVEIALEGECVLRPDALETLDELVASSVALAVVEPPLADAGELWRRSVGGESLGT